VPATGLSSGLGRGDTIAATGLGAWRGFATKAEEFSMPQPTRDQVFISYSHKDTKWRKELEIYLKPYLRDASIISWSDKQIQAGSEWFAEINTALTSTKVAVLLVSPAFIASDFIHEHELGPLLKEAEQGGVKILWVPIRESAYKKTPLKDYQAVLDPSKPLAAMTSAGRDRAWVRICAEIAKAVKKPREPRRPLVRVPLDASPSLRSLLPATPQIYS
jgi:TIR domain